jgi:hypothetical protein
MFKVRKEVVWDKKFQEMVKQAMEDWEGVREEGLAVLSWW